MLKKKKKRPPKKPDIARMLKDILENHISIIQVGQDVDSATLVNRLTKDMTKLRGQISILKGDKSCLVNLLSESSDELRELRDRLARTEKARTDKEKLEKELLETKKELALWRNDKSNSFNHLDL